ncbi:MAG: hypothetical protein HKN85_04270 [Gammaproteobacteria bacterium]|nr:hypothetical protein [Gammaproteobacteria bacterium]
MKITLDKLSPALLFCFCLTVSGASQADNAENWQCELDLQQNSNGTIKLQRIQGSVTGSVTLTRENSDFAQDVEGTWVDQKVNLLRQVSPGNSEPMYGIAVEVAEGMVKMGGRFATDFAGTWSADCDLVSTENTASNDQSKVASSDIEPSTTARSHPPRPSSVDVIQFDATAMHPDGIQSIAIVLDDKEIHRCESDSCSTRVDSLKAGEHQWHVVATSKSGTKNTRRTSSLSVRGVDRASGCSIVGLAFGAAADTSSAMSVRLNGEGQRRSTNFDGGVYSFSGLPAGDYTLNVLAPDNPGVLISPKATSFNCKPGQTVHKNFELR